MFAEHSAARKKAEARASAKEPPKEGVEKNNI